MKQPSLFSLFRAILVVFLFLCTIYNIKIDANSNMSIMMMIPPSTTTKKTTPQHNNIIINKSSNNNNNKRNVYLEYKTWTGYKGMLPLQKYYNVMENKKLYQNWLCKPIPNSNEFNRMKEKQQEEYIIQQQQQQQQQYQQQHQQQYQHQYDKENDSSRKSSNKVEAEYNASLILDPNIHLCPIYIDAHIIVVYKKSGVLSVPGPRRNPNVAGKIVISFI